MVTLCERVTPPFVISSVYASVDGFNRNDAVLPAAVTLVSRIRHAAPRRSGARPSFGWSRKRTVTFPDADASLPSLTSV